MTTNATTSFDIDLKKIINAISNILQRISTCNDTTITATSPPPPSALPSPPRQHQRGGTISPFQGVSKPSISVKAYLERIAKYAGCSPACFVAAYVYLDRLMDGKSSSSCVVVLHSLTVHRLLITSVLLAVKFFDDIYYNNAYYAKVGGISTAEMNFLEIKFLFGLRFELNVTPEIFRSYCSILYSDISLESPTAAPRLHCLLLEEESKNNHQQTQLAV